MCYVTAVHITLKYGKFIVPNDNDPILETCKNVQHAADYILLTHNIIFNELKNTAAQMHEQSKIALI